MHKKMIFGKVVYYLSPYQIPCAHHIDILHIQNSDQDKKVASPPISITTQKVAPTTEA
jgi:hypothetical protein